MDIFYLHQRGRAFAAYGIVALGGYVISPWLDLPLTLSPQHDYGSNLLRLYRGAHIMDRTVLVRRSSRRLGRHLDLLLYERNWIHSARISHLSQASLIIRPKQTGNHVRH
jgi:hypothetical protein